MSEDVVANGENIISLQEEVAGVQDVVVSMADDVERNSANVATLATRALWCGYTRDWNTTGTITYDLLSIVDNNMGTRPTVLHCQAPYTRL